MSLVKPEYIYSLIEEKGLVSVQIYAADGKSLQLEFDNEDGTPSEAKSEVMNFFEEHAEEGLYTVKLCRRSRKQRGEGGDNKMYQFKVKIRDGKSATDKTIGGIPSEFTSDYKTLIARNLELSTQVVKMQEEAKRKEDIARLEKQIEELKNSSPLEKYAPLIAGFFQQGQQAAAVNGQAQQLAAVAGAEDKTEIKKKIVAAVNRLQRVDPNFHETITMLADFAEKDPQKFLSFVPMLKNL